jgi:NAD/NADP transhydrogenase beta subunit
MTTITLPIKCSTVKKIKKGALSAIINIFALLWIMSVVLMIILVAFYNNKPIPVPEWMGVIMIISLTFGTMILFYCGLAGESSIPEILNWSVSGLNAIISAIPKFRCIKDEEQK